MLTHYFDPDDDNLCAHEDRLNYESWDQITRLIPGMKPPRPLPCMMGVI